MISERLSKPEEVARWIVVKESDWPQLNWASMGGIDRITLCPLHRKQVFYSILGLEAVTGRNISSKPELPE